MTTFKKRKAQCSAKLRNSVSNTVQALEQRLLFTVLPFQPGDVIVYQVGTGSASLGSGATAVYLDEYTPSGSLVQSIPLPTSAGGGNNPLTASGTATSEGLINLSQDGTTLLVPGYDAATGVASVATTNTSTTLAVTKVANTTTGTITTALTVAASVGITVGDVVTVSVTVGGNAVTFTSGGNPYTGTIYGRAATSTTITLWGDATASTTPLLPSTTGTATGTVIDASLVPVSREVGVVSANGTIDTTTTLGTALDNSNPRGAVSITGATTTGVWVAGSNGTYYSTVDSASNAASLSTTNARDIEISNGQLYIDSSTNGTAVLGTLGSVPAPTSGTATFTNITGQGSGTSGQGLGGGYQFAFATLSGSSTSPNTLYVADNFNNGVDKFSFVGGVWTLTGEIGAFSTTSAPTSNILSGITGLVAEPVGSNEELFMSTPTNIYSVVDPYGYNSAGPSGNSVFNVSPTLTSVATLTSTSNESFRGIAFSPEPLTTAINANPSSVNTPAGTSPIFVASAYGQNLTVQWQVNTGSGFTNITGTGPQAGLYSGFNTNTLTVLNVTAGSPPSGESGDTFRAVYTNTANSSSATTTAATLTVSAAPSITSLSPTAGVSSGGTSVTITGLNLLGTFTGAGTNSFVYFGTPGPSTLGTVTADSSGSITVTDPSGTAGSIVNVTVVTPGGTSATVTGDQFTYATIPTVTSISTNINPLYGPPSGPDAGGTLVTINGTGFIAGSTVSFYNPSTMTYTPATSGLTVVSYNEITVNSPVGTIGNTDDVEVTTSLGTSSPSSAQMPASTADVFTYTALTNAEAEETPSGTVVTLDDNPIVTAILSEPQTINGQTYKDYAVLVNDGYGSVDLFGTTLAGYTPTIGDKLKIVGTWDPFDDIPEINPVSSVTIISQGNTIPSSYYPNDTISQASVITGGPSLAVPQPLNLAGQLVTFTDASITNVQNSATTYGTTTLTGTISDSSDPTGISFFYYITTYSAENNNFEGQTIPTAPTTITGVVDVFDGAAEFVPISGIGYPEKYVLTTNADTSEDSSLDNFYDVNRGSNIVVTINRTYPAGNGQSLLDIGTLNYSIIPDSAVEATDYTDTDPSAVFNPTTGVITGSIIFPAGTNTENITIDTNAAAADFGDKLFTVEMTSASTNNAASSSNPFGYNPFPSGGPATIVINDPNSSTVVSANSEGDIATILPNGPKMTTTNNVAAITAATISIEANNTTIGADSSYGLLTYDDSDDTTDILINGGTTFNTIDGIELETQNVPESYSTSGNLNVYIVSDTLTGNSQYPVSTLTFNKTSAPLDGLGTQLGAKYLLGTIAFSASQTPGGYVPFNLTGLNPTGVAMLAADLSSGNPFTLAVTPADNVVQAVWEGSNSTIGDTEAPILRVDYATSLPAAVSPWVTQTINGAAATTTWIQSTSTLAVSGAASITTDPSGSGVTPTIAAVAWADTGGNTSTATGAVTIAAASGSLKLFHFAGLSATGGATISVGTTVGTQTPTNHDVLIVSSGGTVTVDSLSKIDLTNNDLIVKAGGATGYATINSEITAGRNGSSPWTGFGIISSTAGGTPGATALGIELNDLNGTALTNSFDGQTVSDGDVLVKYTYVGDANLDGVVNGDDYTLIDNGYNTGASGWRNGDFNYDGSINGSDYLLIDNSFNSHGSTLAVGTPLAQVATTPAAATPSVPPVKPASVFATGDPIPVSFLTGSTSSVTDGVFDDDSKSLADSLLG